MWYDCEVQEILDVAVPCKVKRAVQRIIITQETAGQSDPCSCLQLGRQTLSYVYFKNQFQKVRLMLDHTCF